jgi:PKHD-type hydroxylase
MSLPIFPTNPNIDISKHACTDEFFNHEERINIEKIVNTLGFEDARIVSDGDGGHHDKKYRKSNVKWIYFSEETKWLFVKLMKLIQSTNNIHWNFDLVMAREPIQYTEYTDDGHYDWHIDAGGGYMNQRKVSVSVLLSDPNEYEGGDLQIWPGGEIKIAERVLGGVTLFPSCLLHRVTPVTKGVRKSLVFWVGGTPYR